MVTYDNFNNSKWKISFDTISNLFDVETISHLNTNMAIYLIIYLILNYVCYLLYVR